MSFFKKKSFAVCAAIGVGGALILTALGLLPVTWAVIREVLPEGSGGVCAAIVAGLSVLAATAVVVRGRGREALATGGVIGGAYVLLAALLCALGGSKSAFGPWLAYLTGAVLIGALAGALVSVRQNKHKRRRR